MRFINNPVKAVLSLFAAFVFAFLLCMAVQNHRPALIVLYLGLTALYAVLSFYYTSVLMIDETGVRNCFLLWPYRSLSWDEVKEVGIANMKVMKNAEKKKVGELYFYFSKTAMDEEERLSMCIHWPPKNKCYMRYSNRRLKAVNRYWDQAPALAWLSEEAYLNKVYRQ